MQARHVGVIVAIFFANVWLPTGSRAEGEAQLICEEPNFAFGTRVNTEMVRHTFMMRNVGGATAVISRVHSTCGCTTANPTRMQIPPGEAEPVAAQFNLHGRTGPQNRPLFVNYNSVSNVPLRLSITGTAVAEVAVEPGSIYFGLHASDNPITQTVRIRSYVSNTLFAVTGSTSSAVRFTTHWEEKVPGQEYLLVVTDTQPELTGETNAVVIVTGSAALKGPLRIPVRKMDSNRGGAGARR